MTDRNNYRERDTLRRKSDELETLPHHRCRAKVAHIRQSRPDSGLDFKAEVPRYTVSCSHTHTLTHSLTHTLIHSLTHSLWAGSGIRSGGKATSWRRPRGSFSTSSEPSRSLSTLHPCIRMYTCTCMYVYVGFRPAVASLDCCILCLSTAAVYIRICTYICTYVYVYDICVFIRICRYIYTYIYVYICV